NAVRRTTPGGKANGSSFSSQIHADEPVGASAIAASAPMRQVEALLSIQEVDDATHGRKRALRRGNDLLARLDEIRHALLIGSLPVGRLKSLAHALRAERLAVADPALAEVIAEIELRCAVELAKFGEKTDF